MHKTTLSAIRNTGLSVDILILNQHIINQYTISSSLIVSYILFIFICPFIDSFSLIDSKIRQFFIFSPTDRIEILIDTGNVLATEVKILIPYN